MIINLTGCELRSLITAIEDYEKSLGRDPKVGHLYYKLFEAYSKAEWNEGDKELWKQSKMESLKKTKN